MKNERSPQGSNIPANAFGPAPTSMGELTPPGLVSYPNLPAGVVTDDTPITQTGPGGLGRTATMTGYKP